MSFRRERFVRFGGPDGGPGGSGGCVFFVASSNVVDLSHLYGSSPLIAEAGADGAGANRQGGAGRDLEILVPVGTNLLSSAVSLAFCDDLVEDGEKVLVARGGVGGRGNKSFAAPELQVPKLAELGAGGEAVEVHVNYKMLCDVALVGPANSGKSSLLNRVSRAGAKVASYPLTTFEPVMGMVELGWEQYKFIEIPSRWGVEEDKYRSPLKHASRASLLFVVLDASSDFIESEYGQVLEAIREHGGLLEGVPRVVLLNKIDVSANLYKSAGRFIESLKREYGNRVFEVSAVTGTGLAEVLEEAQATLQLARKNRKGARREPGPLQGRASEPLRVEAIGEGRFEVHGDPLVRLVGGTDMNDWEARAQLIAHMERIGVMKRLEEAGVKPGDTVLIGRKELEWE